MEIPGIASYSGQPTVTNPLDQQARLKGQRSQELSESETKNTVSSQEKAPEDLSVINAVEQANNTDNTIFDRRNPGGSIDFTA